MIDTESWKSITESQLRKAIFTVNYRSGGRFIGRLALDEDGDLVPVLATSNQFGEPFETGLPLTVNDRARLDYVVKSITLERDDDDEEPSAPVEPIVNRMEHRTVQLPAVPSFGHLQPDKWLLVKVLEESSELVEAGKRVIKATDMQAGLNAEADMINEWADVLQTLVNLAVAFDISDSEIESAMLACRERNRERGRL